MSLPKRLVLLISRRIALNAWEISLASTITARAIFYAVWRWILKIVMQLSIQNNSTCQYARSFGATMKESIKRLTHWAAYYHTSRKSWYPKPDGTIAFSKVAVIKPLPSVQMSPDDCEIMRGWASTYGAAVRQRTVRQETTMAKHGTLPEFIYQRQLDSIPKISLNF